MSAIFAATLDPLTWADSAATDAATSVVTAVVGAFASALSGAFDKALGESLGFLNNSSTVDLSHGWWSSGRTSSILSVVGVLTVSLLLMFLLLAVIQGTLAGDPLGVVRVVVVEVPISVMGMAMLVGVTAVLLQATDAASSGVLRTAPGDLLHFYSSFSSPAMSAATGGLLSLIFLVVGLVAALLLWIELAVRSSLIYLLVAFAPLFLAARVWEPAKGGFRKLCHLGIALIVSKFAIALSLGLGAAAIAGGGEQAGSLGAQAGTELSGLITGTSLLMLAAFSPFVVLRLLPVVEAAAVAGGISRSPLRGAQGAMQLAYYGQGLSRLGGGSASVAQGPRGQSPGGPSNGGPPSGGDSPSPSHGSGSGAGGPTPNPTAATGSKSATGGAATTAVAVPLAIAHLAKSKATQMPSEAAAS